MGLGWSGIDDSQWIIWLGSFVQDGYLYELRTLQFNKPTRQMATELQDTELMARTGGGYLVALS